MMNERDKGKTAEFLIGIAGWLFIVDGVLLAATAIIKFAVTPLDALKPDDIPIYTPLVVVAMIGLGAGIRKRREWIRGLAVWVLFLRLVGGVPFRWFSHEYHSIWPLIAGVVIDTGLLIFLTRPIVKQQFLERLDNPARHATSEPARSAGSSAHES